MLIKMSFSFLLPPSCLRFNCYFFCKNKPQREFVRSGWLENQFTFDSVAFGKTLLYNHQPPDLISQGVLKYSANTGELFVGITTLNICSHIFAPGKLRLSTAPNQIPIQFIFTITQILFFCKYKNTCIVL